MTDEEKIIEKEKLLQEAKAEISKRDRHLGVLLEDIDTKFETICEGLDCIESMHQDTRKELREFRGEVNFKFGVAFGELDEVKTNIKVLENGQKRLLEDSQEFFGEQKEQKKQHTQLEHRVAVLELRDESSDGYER